MNNQDQSAFPEPYVNSPNLAISLTKGLTKREYAAIQAMNGLISSEFAMKSIEDDARKRRIASSTVLAELAVIAADSLLSELSKD